MGTAGGRGLLGSGPGIFLREQFGVELGECGLGLLVLGERSFELFGERGILRVGSRQIGAQPSVFLLDLSVVPE